jgi:hypothetical protein
VRWRFELVFIPVDGGLDTVDVSQRI